VPLLAEEVVAKQDQHGQGEHDQGEHVSRLSIRLHSGPVVAVADVGVVARFEACAPSRVHVARIDGCRGDQKGRRVKGAVCLYGKPAWLRRGPSAKRLGLHNASGSAIMEVQNELEAKEGRVVHGVEERRLLFEKTTSSQETCRRSRHPSPRGATYRRRI
jgi:hypothetical protein